jgi:hypothetical protein
MSSFKAMYSTSRELENDGVWVTLGDDIQVKIRRANSKKSKDVRKRLEKPYLSMIRRDTLPDNVQEQIVAKHVAEGILIDWKGMTDDEDKELPFSLEAAVKLCTDYPDFRDDVINLAVEAGTFKAQVLEDTRGNS